MPDVLDRLAIQQSPAPPRGFAHDGRPLAGRLYVGPAGILSGPQARAAILAGDAWALAGRDDLGYAAVSVLVRDKDGVSEAQAGFRDALAWSAREGQAVADFLGAALNRASMRRGTWAGLSFDRPRVMGIVNVTPDSFSDGGRFFAAEAAVARGIAMVEAGADIIDVGGESTRPGADPVSPDEEVRRVVPVVKALAERGLRVSIDTRRARVMAAAIEAGAAIVNDVTALTGDPESLPVVARTTAAVCLMHMQGEPQTMQARPQYDCAPLDVHDYLTEAVEACVAGGIARDRLCVDPGIGFGKTVEHNLQILQRLALYQTLGVPVLLGVSRKTFIGRLSRDEPAHERLGGSLAVAMAGLDQGVQLLRVHDVAETVQAVALWRALHC